MTPPHTLFHLTFSPSSFFSILFVGKLQYCTIEVTPSGECHLGGFEKVSVTFAGGYVQVKNSFDEGWLGWV